MGQQDMGGQNQAHQHLHHDQEDQGGQQDLELIGFEPPAQAHPELRPRVDPSSKMMASTTSTVKLVMDCMMVTLMQVKRI